MEVGEALDVVVVGVEVLVGVGLVVELEVGVGVLLETDEMW